MTAALRRTPLHDRHTALGARMVPFAGWDMPVLYSSIVAEHKAVRERAGLFDVSHMGELRLRGTGAVALAQRLFTNDIASAAPGRVRYGLFCREDGGAVDDVTAYRIGPEEVLFCVNASNTDADRVWVEKARDEGGVDCEILDETEATALLAIQGPDALAITARLAPADLRPPRPWTFRETELQGIPVWLSRTGYPGEDGYEFYAPAEAAAGLWDALLEAGGERLLPAGLGARDTLRTEMAYPLYGHELDLDRTPIQAGLERFLAFGQGFIGEPALAAERERGPAQRLVGLVLESRGVARAGHPILAKGERIGSVTSGTHAPSVERSIAIGYVPAELAARGASGGDELSIEVRGRPLPCKITKTPFYRRKK